MSGDAVAQPVGARCYVSGMTSYAKLKGEDMNGKDAILEDSDDGDDCIHLDHELDPINEENRAALQMRRERRRHSAKHQRAGQQEHSVNRKT